MGVHHNISQATNWDIPAHDWEIGTNEVIMDDWTTDPIEEPAINCNSSIQTVEATSTETIKMENIGTLKGHNGAITCIQTPTDDPNIIITGSADNNVIVWNIESTSASNTKIYGDIDCILKGHHDAITDLTISADAKHFLSASMDGSMKLWKIEDQECITDFIEHTKGVIGVVFSRDNRRIYSIGLDNNCILWNTIAVVKYTETLEAKEWFSCISFRPYESESTEFCVTGGNFVKFWDCTECIPDLKVSSKGEHKGKITSICVAPDGSLVASADEYGMICIWDAAAALDEGRKSTLCTFEASCGKFEIKNVIFSPNRYWTVIAVKDEVQIFDLETKTSIARLKREDDVSANCIAWSSDGNILFCGHDDNTVSIWKLIDSNSE